MKLQDERNEVMGWREQSYMVKGVKYFDEGNEDKDEGNEV